jgi:prephenate dehydrogenase
MAPRLFAAILRSKEIKMAISHVRIVGAGLIGTSIGLGLRRAGIRVSMDDASERARDLASDLMGSDGTPDDSLIDFVLIATPVGAIAEVISSELGLNPQSRFIDVASVKIKVKDEVSTSGLAPSRFLPSHPMAGREVGGPESARADLFEGRPWIIDSAGVDSDLVDMGRELISILGGVEIDLASADHDQAVALVSHLPQLVASLLAKQLHSGDPAWLELAGAGLRDTTRIAGSDPELWREIIVANQGALTPLLTNLRNDIDALISNIENQSFIENLISDGQSGRARIPGKHGGRSREYTFLPVVIDDKPGQLASLFDECADAAVNVEDLSIEHSPGQFTGLITLALSASDAKKLQLHLREKGWRVHDPR